MNTVHFAFINISAIHPDILPKNKPAATYQNTWLPFLCGMLL